MSANDFRDTDMRPTGYAEIIQRLGRQVISNWHESMVIVERTHRIEAVNKWARMGAYPSLLDSQHPCSTWTDTGRAHVSRLGSDAQADLFIRFCFQNDGRPSARKWMRHFQFLTNDEVTQIEEDLGPPMKRQKIDKKS